MTRPWPPGSATGIGSLPGDDPDEAARLVVGELPDLPHLPELPGRGGGAELIGRTAALLVDLAVEIQPSGWQVTARPGRDLRRARDLLERDLDAVEEQTQGYTGAFKVQAAGPWTLAAGIELASGHRVVTDHGAARDLASSLAEGLRMHLADLAQRIPGASLVLQLDEPSLPAVLRGTLPTVSGWGTVRSVEVSLVEQTLRDVLSVAPEGGRVVHCCAADVPLAMLRAAGADALSIDLRLRPDPDALGEAIDGGTSLWLGVLPSTDERIGPESVREPVLRLWRMLGFPEEQLAGAVVPTPACGLAGASPGYARRAMELLREGARSFTEPAE